MQSGGQRDRHGAASAVRLRAVHAQVERVRRGGELPPWYDLSEWDHSGDTPAADSQSVSLQVLPCRDAGTPRGLEPSPGSQSLAKVLNVIGQDLNSICAQSEPTEFV